MALIRKIIGNVVLLTFGIVCVVYMTGFDWRSVTFLMLATFAIFVIVSWFTPKR